jgi:hypothetical protein
LPVSARGDDGACGLGSTARGLRLLEACLVGLEGVVLLLESVHPAGLFEESLVLRLLDRDVAHGDLLVILGGGCGAARPGDRDVLGLDLHLGAVSRSAPRRLRRSSA